MHTKKTNNTNKLMQISYHFALTKIQKLQNLKNNNKIKKTFFLYWPVCPVFFPVWNRGVNRIGLLAGMVYTGCTSWYSTVLTPLIFMINPIFWNLIIMSCISTSSLIMSRKGIINQFNCPLRGLIRRKYTLFWVHISSHSQLVGPT